MAHRRYGNVSRRWGSLSCPTRSTSLRATKSTRRASRHAQGLAHHSCTAARARTHSVRIRGTPYGVSRIGGVSDARYRQRASRQPRQGPLLLQQRHGVGCGRAVQAHRRRAVRAHRARSLQDVFVCTGSSPDSDFQEVDERRTGQSGPTRPSALCCTTPRGRTCSTAACIASWTACDGSTRHGMDSSRVEARATAKGERTAAVNLGGRIRDFGRRRRLRARRHPDVPGSPPGRFRRGRRRPPAVARREFRRTHARTVRHASRADVAV